MVDIAYVSPTVLMDKFFESFVGHLLWVIMTAKGLSRRMGPLSSIMHVGNLVNVSIRIPDLIIICMGDCMGHTNGGFHYYP